MDERYTFASSTVLPRQMMMDVSSPTSISQSALWVDHWMSRIIHEMRLFAYFETSWASFKTKPKQIKNRGFHGSAVELTDTFSMAGQIQAADVAQLAAAGYETIICNRPDDEEPHQPSMDSIEEPVLKQALRSSVIP